MKVGWHNYVVLFLLQVSCFNFSISQERENYDHYALAEKIYLQLDSEVYTTDKTIWFKAVLANAASHNLNITSGVLYVELISFEEKIVQSKIIKIKDGIGEGHFDLDRSYPEGIYQIKAYTEWNKNFDRNFVFEKYIQIFSEKVQVSKGSPIQNIRRIDSTVSLNRFRVDLYPNLIDADHRRDLKAYVGIDGKLDTVYVKRAADNEKYPLGFEVPKTSQKVTVKFETRKGMDYETSFYPNVDYFDLQFFPESGKFVEGLSSKVGFKAIDANGNGVDVEGEILNHLNEVVTTFKSSSLGMGSFTLDRVKSDEPYRARVTLKNNKPINEVIELPRAHKQGYTLKVET